MPATQYAGWPGSCDQSNLTTFYDHGLPDCHLLLSGSGNYWLVWLLSSSQSDCLLSSSTTLCPDSPGVTRLTRTDHLLAVQSTLITVKLCHLPGCITCIHPVLVLDPNIGTAHVKRRDTSKVFDQKGDLPMRSWSLSCCLSANVLTWYKCSAWSFQDFLIAVLKKATTRNHMECSWHYAWRITLCPRNVHCTTSKVLAIQAAGTSWSLPLSRVCLTHGPLPGVPAVSEQINGTYS